MLGYVAVDTFNSQNIAGGPCGRALAVSGILQNRAMIINVAGGLSFGTQAESAIVLEASTEALLSTLPQHMHLIRKANCHRSQYIIHIRAIKISS